MIISVCFIFCLCYVPRGAGQLFVSAGCQTLGLISASGWVTRTFIGPPFQTGVDWDPHGPWAKAIFPAIWVLFKFTWTVGVGPLKWLAPGHCPNAHWVCQPLVSNKPLGVLCPYFCNWCFCICLGLSVTCFCKSDAKLYSSICSCSMLHEAVSVKIISYVR